MTTRSLRIIFTCLLVIGVLASSANATVLVKVTADRVNVRARPSTGSEVITQLRNGESVVFVEEVPSVGGLRWAKIQLPDNTPVWLSAEFIDPVDKAVIPQRLNVRSGPGANFNVVGQLIYGETVKEIRTVQGWMEIASPQGSYAFLAAKYLSNYDPKGSAPAPTKATPSIPRPSGPKASELIAAPEIRADDSTLPIPSAIRPKTSATAELTMSSSIIEPSAPVLNAPAAPKLVEAPAEPGMKAIDAPVTPAPVAEVAATPEPVSAPPMKPLVAAPVGPVVAAPVKPVVAAPVTPAFPEATTSAAPDLPETGVNDDPAFTRRVVTRLGIVKYSYNIQSPTSYRLIDPRSKRFMNYLYSSDTGLELKYYSGKTITVTGEEYIDKRWPTRPLIEIRTLKPQAE
ncbi:SH3 domain-containing protein [Verrucomicrobia bacterium]|nr:SH3 domain-containing protein [Verrucomicrobiota bacterium]